MWGRLLPLPRWESAGVRVAARSHSFGANTINVDEVVGRVIDPTIPKGHWYDEQC